MIQSENVFSVTTLGSPNTMATYDTLNDACMPQPFVQTGHPGWGDPENHPSTPSSLRRCARPSRPSCPGRGRRGGLLVVGGGLKDATDPQFADEPYVSFMNEQLEAAGLGAAVGNHHTGFGLFGWTWEQALRIAAELPDGLTRPNLILAVRSMESMSHPLLLEGVEFGVSGVEFGVSGAEDAYFIEGSEFSRFTRPTSRGQEGEIIDNNGQSGLCAWMIDSNICG
ncbi:MAG TPA: hypothetical protein VMM81_00950 [Acidimicrobiia bacterium]|nr:hypothetical protein [Acidimicrobiia bacterium]